ncbi:hypothetical protein T439DRAFT_356784 [Meredithblackwellia eburnea MCA 4105]
MTDRQTHYQLLNKEITSLQLVDSETADWKSLELPKLESLYLIVRNSVQIPWSLISHFKNQLKHLKVEVASARENSSAHYRSFLGYLQECPKLETIGFDFLTRWSDWDLDGDLQVYKKPTNFNQNEMNMLVARLFAFRLSQIKDLRIPLSFLGIICQNSVEMPDTHETITSPLLLDNLVVHARFALKSKEYHSSYKDLFRQDGDLRQCLKTSTALHTLKRLEVVLLVTEEFHTEKGTSEGLETMIASFFEEFKAEHQDSECIVRICFVTCYIWVIRWPEQEKGNDIIFHAP